MNKAHGITGEVVFGKNVRVYVEKIPDHYDSDLSITITCKKTELQEADAIIDYLSSIINIKLNGHSYE